MDTSSTNPHHVNRQKGPVQQDDEAIQNPKPYKTLTPTGAFEKHPKPCTILTLYKAKLYKP